MSEVLDIHGEAPVQFSESEWQARVDLAACYRLVDYYGWTDQVYNHITLRIPGTDHLLINEFGLRYDEITASNLVKIDIDGNQVDGGERPVNLAGYTIHSAVHAARPDDLHCVLHTHSDNARLRCPVWTVTSCPLPRPGAASKVVSVITTLRGLRWTLRSENVWLPIWVPRIIR